MRRLRGAALLATGLLFAGCDGGGADGAPEAAADPARAAVTRMTELLQNAVARREALAITELFAEDAVLHLPGEPPLEGRDAIGARIAEVLPRVLGYSLSSQRFDAGGQVAWEAQVFELTLSGPSGDPIDFDGHQLVVFGLQPDGSWKIARAGSWLAPAAAPHVH